MNFFQVNYGFFMAGCILGALIGISIELVKIKNILLKIGSSCDRS